MWAMLLFLPIVNASVQSVAGDVDVDMADFVSDAASSSVQQPGTEYIPTQSEEGEHDESRRKISPQTGAHAPEQEPYNFRLCHVSRNDQLARIQNH